MPKSVNFQSLQQVTDARFEGERHVRRQHAGMMLLLMLTMLSGLSLYQRLRVNTPVSNTWMSIFCFRFHDIRKSCDSTRVSSYRQFQFIDFFRFRAWYAYLMPSSRPTALHVHPDEILGNGQVLWSWCQIYVHVPYLIEKVQQILCKGIDATWEHRFAPLAGRLPRLEGWILLAWFGGIPFEPTPTSYEELRPRSAPIFLWGPPSYAFFSVI
jgi:hypothetical protein